MRTRKNKSESASARASAPETPASVAPTVESESKNNERISFYIGADGMPQWERLQGKTVEQLKSIFANETAREKLGVKAPTKEAFEVGFDATEANGVLDLLEIITALGASKVFDVPHEVTSKAFTYSQLHREKLVPPFAKLMNKWGPSIIKTWKDEIGAGIVFLSVTNAQVKVMRHLDAQRKSQQPKIVREMPRPVSEKQPEPQPAPEPEKPTEEDNPVMSALNA